MHELAPVYSRSNRSSDQFNSSCRGSLSSTPAACIASDCSENLSQVYEKKMHRLPLFLRSLGSGFAKKSAIDELAALEVKIEEAEACYWSSTPQERDYFLRECVRLSHLFFCSALELLKETKQAPSKQPRIDLSTFQQLQTQAYQAYVALAKGDSSPSQQAKNLCEELIELRSRVRAWCFRRQLQVHTPSFEQDPTVQKTLKSFSQKVQTTVSELKPLSNMIVAQ